MAKLAIFLPNWSKGNPYLMMFKDAIGRCGVDVRLRDFPPGFFPINRIISREDRPYVVHIHWINDLIEAIHWSSTSLKTHTKLALLMLDIAVARLRGVKIFWTIHNLVAHESPNPTVEIRARRALALTCTHLFAHSHSALRLIEKTYCLELSRKASVMPLGNYDGYYPNLRGSEDRLRARFGLTKDHTVILFFGAIRPYKGVDKLIHAFRTVDNEQLRLLITGKAESIELGNAITLAAQSDSRIIAAVEFVPDDDVGALFAIADVVAIPFERTLTSASAMLAFTMNKALLLPERARVFDFVNDDNAIFYGSDGDLHSRLLTLDRERLAAMGLKGRLAVEGFDWNSIGARVVARYDS